MAVVATFVSSAQQAIITTAYAKAGDGSPRDPNIKYVGRWENNGHTAISYWPGAYLITKFTGTTVKVKLPQDPKEAVTIYVSIDSGPDTLYANARGTVNLTPTPLKSGITHSLRIAAASEHDDIRFQGLILDSGATTVSPRVSPFLVEFVGDSITSGRENVKGALDVYAWLIGERLGVRHTQIAQAGISLVGEPNAVGMKDQYFKLRTIYFPTSPDWDFAHHQANAVVINIGTNDSHANASDAVFQSTYVTFLQNIRAKYPHAQIFVLRLFKGGRLGAIQSTVKQVNAAGDRKVHYVDTIGWIDTSRPSLNEISTSDTIDSVHPTCIGHTKIANKLGPIMASFLKILWKPLPVPSSCPAH
jgi:lysophospholipase L1-like esterase